jgi:molybdopterin/thiamine biosynthesis adenylyltransferase
MTSFSATFREDQLSALRAHHLRADGCEHASYVLFNRAAIKFDPWDRAAHQKLLASTILPVANEQVIESTPTLVTWRTASFLGALKRAEATGRQVVGILHNHPAGVPGFSPQDDLNEPELVQLARNRNGPDTPLVSMILTADGLLNGRIWLSPTYQMPMRQILVLGDRFSLHYPGRGMGRAPAAFDRQVRALGAALHQDLSRLRIAVVGCGGTGSAVAMLLARLGVGHLVLIDNDVVDVTNLNRLHGARQADADAMRLKVKVVGRAITELGLGIKVVMKEAWVGDPDCRDALRACDVIFACTDDHEGRLFLNRLALFYLIPTIDLGLHMKLSDQPGGDFQALDGRITIILPGKTCLACRGVINAVRAGEEALRRSDPGLYERRKIEAYVFGEGEPNPAVVTFTTELACMAVNEMLHRIQGFRGQGAAMANWVRQFHRMTDFKPGARPTPGCVLCDSEMYWGRGDMSPFLDRIA